MFKVAASTLLFFLVNKNKSVFSECVHAAEILIVGLITQQLLVMWLISVPLLGICRQDKVREFPRLAFVVIVVPTAPDLHTWPK